MFRVDLHTHSSASPDGGISIEQYTQILSDTIVDYIAVTDHNSIEMAVRLHKLLGDKIIIGEEIMSKNGEIIGLFLTKKVEPGQTASDTIQAIRAQKGIVYIPHPLETFRKGLSEKTMNDNLKFIDVIEAYNGRAVAQNRGPGATVWARLNQKPTAAASDAHGAKGVGTAYTMLGDKPTRQNLVQLLQKGRLTMRRPPLHTLLYPKLNRLTRALKGGA